MPHLLDQLNIPHQRNVPLAPLTWYALGGRAEVLVRPQSVEQLAELLSYCRQNQSAVFILGSGANLLVADEGIDGVVIRLDAPAFCQMHINDSRVTAGAGYDLMKLVRETAKAGLGGLEGLAGIPASVGGAVRMNAGGSFGQIGDVIARVRVMENDGRTTDLLRDRLAFEYRRTNITAPIILEAEFELARADADQLTARVKEVFDYKKHSQPMAANSPGCAYKNPRSLPAAAAHLPASAGAIIDAAGLKGYRVGAAVVSDRHANFIVAEPGATAGDVLAVLEHIERTVQEKFGITLEREVVCWP